MSWLLGQVNLRAFLSLEILWSDLLHVKLFRRGFVVSQFSLGDKNCLSLWWDLFRHFIRLLDSSKHWEGSNLPFLWVAGPFCSNELCSFVTTFESSVVLSPPLKGPFIIQGSWKMKPYVLGLCDFLAVRGVGDDVVDLVHAVFFTILLSLMTVVVENFLASSLIITTFSKVFKLILTMSLTLPWMVISLPILDCLNSLFATDSNCEINLVIWDHNYFPTLVSSKVGGLNFSYCPSPR